LSNKPFFPKKIWGYKQDEVEDFLAKLTLDHENDLKTLEKECSYLKEDNKKLEEEVAKLKKEIAKYHEKERALSHVLIQAQLQATSIEEEARKKAEEIENAAQAKVDARMMELKNLQNQYMLAHKEFKLLLEKYLTIVKELDIFPDNFPDNSPEKEGQQEITNWEAGEEIQKVLQEENEFQSGENESPFNFSDNFSDQDA